MANDFARRPVTQPTAELAVPGDQAGRSFGFRPGTQSTIVMAMLEELTEGNSKNSQAAQFATKIGMSRQQVASGCWGTAVWLSLPTPNQVVTEAKENKCTDQVIKPVCQEMQDTEDTEVLTAVSGPIKKH